jgi:hypothetical protein
MEFPKITRFNLPIEIRAALGDIIIVWSRTEALIAEFLSFLLKADQGAMYVLNQDIASGTQMKWVKLLAADKFTNANTQANLQILFARIDAARGERNAYVHGVWAPGPSRDTACVQTIKMDRAERIRDELVTAPDLHDLLSEIESIGDELAAILKALKVIT